MRAFRGVVGLFLAWAISLEAGHAAEQAPRSNEVLAVVNGQSIVERDLALLMLSRRIPPEQQPALRERFLELLIERQLMREYLAARKAQPSQTELERQLAQVLKVIQDGGEEPDQVLSRLGLTRESLKQELALPLTWQSHLRLVVTGQRLREYFEKHRSQFDGTQVRVRQIFLKLPAEAEAKTVKAAEDKLRLLKTDLEAGRLTFADAARKHSESPSGENGGDVGWITPQGKLPAVVSRAAFSLKVGEFSDPLRSPFGLHLFTVTERQPGELSLEDVRSVVFNHLSQELWDETVKAQRAKAQITMNPSSKK